MRHYAMLIALAGLGLTAGCNSTDALTPQVDVGGGTFRSPPVNQADLDTMSEQTAYVAPPKSVPLQSMAAQSGSLPLTGSTGFAAPATVMEQGDTAYTDPAGTLDAQAGQLSRGEAPSQLRAQSSAQSSALALPRLADEDDTAVAAPDTTPAQEEVESAASEPPPAAQQSAPATTQTAALPTPSQAGDGSIRFLPIIGAPVSAVTPLSKQLGTEARADGLTIKAAADTTSRHILKGYFSALKDGSKTTVIYVWDVLDNAGNRLHRIQGQETVEASAPDLWSAVPATTMETIGTRTIKAYQDWRSEQAG